MGKRTVEASAGCTCAGGIAGHMSVRVLSMQTGSQQDTSEFQVDRSFEACLFTIEGCFCPCIAN